MTAVQTHDMDAKLYLEDLRVGQRFTSRSHLLDESEITFLRTAIRSSLLFEHALFRKPVSTPHHVRGRLFRDHAPSHPASSRESVRMPPHATTRWRPCHGRTKQPTRRIFRSHRTT